MKKYYIKTFGCAMNHSDSERIAAFLEKNNIEPSSDINEADLIIYNTCGVRQMAEDRVYGQIHNLTKHRTHNTQHIAHSEKPMIVLTGCVAERPDVQRRLKNKVDLFTSIKDFPKKFQKLLDASIDVSIDASNYFNIAPKLKNPYQAVVPIMTGCNNFCAYCVVPYARGREESRPVEEILNEVKNLVNSGCREIILTGQNVNSYRGAWSMEHETKTFNFSQLLKEVNKIPGEFWINFISNHPKDVTDEMIETVTGCEKVCENFHLPIQAGSNEVLENMNRKYTAQKYMEILEKIKTGFKKNKPGKLFSITCDIIVGFPGETEEQLEETAEIMRKAKFDMVYFGQFSPRPQTAAWKMEDNISKEEKVRREKYLTEILKKTAKKNNEKYVGKTMDVLIEKSKSSSSEKGGAGGGFEKLSKKKNSSCTQIPLNPPLEKRKLEYFGKTRSGKNVKITVPNCHPELVEGSPQPGQIIPVKITRANTWNLEAQLT